MVARRKLWGSTKSWHRHARTCQLGHLFLLVLLASQMAALLPCGLHVVWLSCGCRLCRGPAHRCARTIHSGWRREPWEARPPTPARVGGGGWGKRSGTVRMSRERIGTHAPPKFGGGQKNWRSLHIEPTQTPKSSTRHSVPPLPPKTKLAARLRPDCAETGRISRALEVGRDVKL